VVRTGDAKTHELLRQNIEIIKALAKVSEADFIPEGNPAPGKAMSCVIRGAEIFIPMEGLVDLEAEVARLQKEKSDLEKEIASVRKKLSNHNFLAKAPKDVVEKEKQKEKDYLDMLKRIEARLKILSGGS
jgi:valyl-tRNA synthetase